MPRHPPPIHARDTPWWRAALAWVVLATAALGAEERGRVALYVARGAPAAAATVAGVRGGLLRAGIEPVLERSAPDDPDRARGVLAEMAHETVDVVVAVGPQAARDARDGVRHLAVVFTGVGRPAALGLPGRTNVCGTAGGIGGENVVAAIRRVAPSVRRLIVVVADGDPEDLSFREELRTAAERAGLAASWDDGRLDTAGAAMVLAENVPGPRADEIAAYLAGSGALLVGTRRAHLDAGAALVVRTDPEQVGTTAAALVRRIVRGEAPEDIGVVRPARRLVELNLDAARRLGVAVSLEAVAGADHVVPDFGGRR